MAKTKKDVYCNRAFVRVQASAINTITFQQINFAVGVFQGIAIKLNRVEIHPGLTGMYQLNDDSKWITAAMTLRDDLTSLDANNQSVLLKTLFFHYADGALAELLVSPWVWDFSGLPEGGLLIPANPLYVAVDSNAIDVAAVIEYVLYYQFVQLTDREAIELLQTIIPGQV